MPTENRLRTEILMHWERILVLEPEWNSLLRESRADIFFLSWEWVHAWYSVAGRSVQPFVVTVRDANGFLAGLAPFYFHGHKFLHCLPYRMLRIMADRETGAECLDWIVRADVENDVYRSILSALEKASPHWDCIWMPYVPGWTGATDRMLCACAEQRFFTNTRPIEFGFVNLPTDAEAFYKELSKNMRSQLKRQKNAMIQSRNFEIRSCRSADEIETYIDALFDLHHRRRSVLGDEGVFRRKPREAEFYRTFLPKAQKNGWLRVYGLFVEGTMKAVQLGYVYNGAYYQIQEGFDPGFRSGIGNVLRLHAIEACIAEGLTGYDFLAEMSVHKKRWSATPRFGSDVFIGKRNVKNALLFKSGIWPTGKYLRPSS